MAVYREMDLGTAKPTAAERAAARWHLVDLVDPAEEYSVVAFQRAARAAVAEIEERGHRAAFVGGTGLYHRAVLDGLEFPGRYLDVAAELEAAAERPGGVDELYRRLRELDPAGAARIEPGNRRRVVRALEVTIGSGRPFSSYGPGLTDYPPSPARLIGLAVERDELGRRVTERFDDQLRQGLLGEVEALAARPSGLSRTARQAIGYRELLDHVEQGVPLEASRDAALRRLRTFARRQQAWFGRDPRVEWVEAGPGLTSAVRDLLA